MGVHGMPKPMKIIKVTPLMPDRCLCVTVETDAGFTGLGCRGRGPASLGIPGAGNAVHADRIPDDHVGVAVST